MSVYLSNLNPEVNAVIQAGAITFRKEGIEPIHMACGHVAGSYQMDFYFSGQKTTIKAKSGVEVASKIVNVVNDLIRLNTLKGSI